MVTLDPVASHWQCYYDGRVADGAKAHFMQVLGYHPQLGDDYEGLFARILNDIAGKLQMAPEQRFLDIACGFGVFSRQLAAGAGLAVGTDLAGALLRKGAALPLCEGAQALYGAIQANAADQPFADQSFDRVLCFGMFFHLNPTSARAVVGEIVRLLKPGGRALIGDVLDPRRIHCERSYIDRVPSLMHWPLRQALCLKASIDRRRGKVVYQPFLPSFFERLLPADVRCYIFESKDDGRRNNTSRYDVVITR